MAIWLLISFYQLCPPTTQSLDFLNRTSVEDGRVMTSTQTVTAAAPTKPGPTLVKVNHMS